MSNNKDEINIITNLNISLGMTGTLDWHKPRTYHLAVGSLLQRWSPQNKTEVLAVP